MLFLRSSSPPTLRSIARRICLTRAGVSRNAMLTPFGERVLAEIRSPHGPCEVRTGLAPPLYQPPDANSSVWPANIPSTGRVRSHLPSTSDLFVRKRAEPAQPAED